MLPEPRESSALLGGREATALRSRAKRLSSSALAAGVPTRAWRSAGGSNCGSLPQGRSNVARSPPGIVAQAPSSRQTSGQILKCVGLLIAYSLSPLFGLRFGVVILGCRCGGGLSRGRGGRLGGRGRLHGGGEVAGRRFTPPSASNPLPR